MQLFSQEWVSEWVHNINTDPAYKAESKNWNWPVVFELQDDGVISTSIYLDLKQGECKRWYYNEEGKKASAAFVFTAPTSHWETLINDRKDPIFCIIKGFIKLEKGNILSLSRYSKSGKRLLELCPGTSVNSEPDNTTSKEAIQVPISPIATRTTFTSTESGLDMNSFPMQLFQKAKRLGIWNPTDIDFSTDKNDWDRLQENEQQLLLHLTSLFVAGEESVTSDILPLMSVIAREGRVEEEIYLTSFLWEEAKHTEFFNVFLQEVAISEASLAAFHSDAYKTIFYEELPATMNALYVDASPIAQAKAAVTYNMIVEGTLAETGYHAYYSMLDKAGIMPGLKEGIGHLKRDESRHIAYGLYLISRLIAEDPHIYSVVQERMQELIEPAIGFINEIFEMYDDDMPFGLQRKDFIDYALSQFRKRLDKLHKVTTQGLENIMFD